MLVCTDPEPDADRTDDCDGWTADATADGRRVLGSAIEDPSDAVTVRVRDGRVELHKGSECAARVVGFDVLECTDRDDAIDVVSRHPMARIGRIEIRAFVDL
jgi:hypothetical protein